MRKNNGLALSIRTQEFFATEITEFMGMHPTSYANMGESCRFFQNKKIVTGYQAWSSWTKIIDTNRDQTETVLLLFIKYCEPNREKFKKIKIKGGVISLQLRLYTENNFSCVMEAKLMKRVAELGLDFSIELF